MSNAAIAACARAWIGTRFHHQGRLKRSANHKGGVDCLGLLVGVAAELELRGPDNKFITDFDECDYSHQPDVLYLQQTLCRVLTPIPVESILPGDILLLRIDDSPQHLGIVSQTPRGLGIIHAFAQARAVIEHELDDWWRIRIHTAFRYQH